MPSTNMLSFPSSSFYSPFSYSLLCGQTIHIWGRTTCMDVQCTSCLLMANLKPAISYMARPIFCSCWTWPAAHAWCLPRLLSSIIRSNPVIHTRTVAFTTVLTTAAIETMSHERIVNRLRHYVKTLPFHTIQFYYRPYTRYHKTLNYLQYTKYHIVLCIIIFYIWNSAPV